MLMSEYTVEKSRFSIKLFFPSGAPSEGDIFLSSFAAHHEGHEHVIDVLNQTDQFVPIHFKDESIKLINKNNILMVTFPSDKDETEDPLLADSSVEVVIHLINDICLEGFFFFSLPAHSRRVKDFLNQSFMDKPESFLELRKGTEVCLVNKAYILFVEEKKSATGGNK
jgi:hypothetical protein